MSNVIALSRVVAAGVVLLVAAGARGEVRVSALVGDHMVVQQNRPIRLTGTAAPGEAIRATLGPHGSSSGSSVDSATTTSTAKSDNAGRWLVTLPARPAGGPFALTIAGANTLKFSDIWSGEVWLASGQSNMEFPLAHASSAKLAAEGGCAGLHLFVVAHAMSVTPKPEVQGTWQPCNQETDPGFSAVAFHFGQELQRALGVPVGLVQATWGGTPAEAWTARAALEAEPALKPMVEALDSALHDHTRRKELEQALVDWEKKNLYQDQGNRGEALGFALTGGGGKGWSTMELPQVWEDAGLAIDGAVWFRREVILPDTWAGQDLALALGPIDDFDTTYWNGEQVGATGADTPQHWAAPRRYTIPGRLARSERNVIAVRVFDHYGNGGFAGTASQLSVAAPGADSLPLAGTWYYKIERRLPPTAVDWDGRPRVLGLDDSSSPSMLWNAMVAPLRGLPLAGVIWYQGESNVGRADQYRTLFPTLIRSWRSAWGTPPLPFLFVQLPNFTNPGTSKIAPLGSGDWADLREAQTAALHQPRTGMAVALDIGEADNIHPRNKIEVGRRLALAALRTAYGKDVIASGPTFLSAAREGRAMRVRFTAVAGGLVTSDGKAPRGFLVADADHAWHKADARVEGESVVVSSADVSDPIAVRYAWANDPPNTLRSLADLPAAPFRSDNW